MNKACGRWKVYTCILGSLAIALVLSRKYIMEMPLYSWLLHDTGWPKMYAECGIIGILVFVMLRTLPINLAATLIVIGVLAFSYIHVLLFPVLVGIAYVLSLFLVGHTFKFFILSKENDTSLFLDFVLGCAFSTLLTFLLSAFQHGSIELIRVVWIVFSFIASAVVLKRERKRIHQQITRIKGMHWKPSAICAFLCAICVAEILLELGRCNGALDYDSLWYGIRPESVLTDGTGVFEDLGLVGLVFWYPKLYEILMLPVSALPSYAFLPATNLIFGILTLVVIFCLVNCVSGKEAALLACALCMSIPSFAVMLIHVKPDMVTVLFQVLMVYFAVRELKQSGSKNIAGLISAWLFSLGCKPTAIAFSNVLVLALGIMLFIWKKRRVYNLCKSVYLIIPAMLASVCSFVRTYVITGMPMNSLGGSIFSRLGFKAKAPYVFTQTVGSAGGQSIGEALKVYLDKLYTLWIYPLKQNYGHIDITWVGPLGILLGGILIIGLFSKRFRKEIMYRYESLCIYAVFLIMLCVSMGSLLFLRWIDGNYFLLLYVLIVIAFAVGFSSMYATKHLFLLCLPLMIFGWLYSGMNGWAEDKWFRYTDFVNRGYVDDRAQRDEELYELFPEIFEVLKSDPSQRIAVYADPVLTARLPNVAEQIEYVDSFASTQDFHRFLKETQKDYILLEKSKISREERLRGYLGDLVNEGYISDILINDNYMLCAVLKEPVVDQAPVQARHYENFFSVGSDYLSIKKEYGFFDDGWIGEEASFLIQTKKDGLIHLSFYGIEEFAGETSNIFVDGELVECIMQNGSFIVQLEAEENRVVQIRIDNSSFAKKLDSRVLSVILGNVWAE